MTDIYFGYRTLIVVLVLAMNAFFAAAEVALLSSRKSLVRRLAEKGNSGAQAAMSLLADPERMLSVVQVGVTLASLGLGWAGEDTFYRVLVVILQPWETPVTRAALHGASFALAFLVITFLHVVIGEVVPKNLAIEKAERLAVLVAPPLLFFHRLSAPFVYVIEKSAAAVSRGIGLSEAPHAGGHSVEEIKFILSSSRKEGHLEPFEEQSIKRLLELQEHSAREIMVPRHQIVSVSVNATLDYVLRIMDEHQYSRLPVYEGRPENIVGVVHFKDLFREWMERRAAHESRKPVPPFRLRNLMRKPLVAPESKPLESLVDEFRKSHAHMAIVVDEFGTITGLVTLEDVLEQVFGEIEDEHDLRRPPPPAEARLVELDGTVNIRDLETQYGIELPGDAGFETLAGFLLFKLGYIPQAGEHVDYGGRRYTIAEMDNNRIARVVLERLPAAPPQPGRDR